MEIHKVQLQVSKSKKYKFVCSKLRPLFGFQSRLLALKLIFFMQEKHFLA